MKKYQSITNKIYPAALICAIIIIWHIATQTGWIPEFMLPSPISVVEAFVKGFPVLMEHSAITLSEAFIGLGISIVLGFIIALLMDRFNVLYKMLHPVLVVTQTIPTVAIAPLLVLWFGYNMEPKIVLIVMVCFFPITVSLLSGFKSSDIDAINLVRAMGAKKHHVYRYIKIPNAMPGFFSGLRISVSYSVVGAVIAEWLGGTAGLGVYMIRVKKSYAFDKMFAVIILIVIVSLLLMKLVDVVEKRIMPWKRIENDRVANVE